MPNPEKKVIDKIADELTNAQATRYEIVEILLSAAGHEKLKKEFEEIFGITGNIQTFDGLPVVVRDDISGDVAFKWRRML